MHMVSDCLQKENRVLVRGQFIDDAEKVEYRGPFSLASVREQADKQRCRAATLRMLAPQIRGGHRRACARVTIIAVLLNIEQRPLWPVALGMEQGEQGHQLAVAAASGLSSHRHPTGEHFLHKVGRPPVYMPEQMREFACSEQLRELINN